MHQQPTGGCAGAALLKSPDFDRRVVTTLSENGRFFVLFCGDVGKMLSLLVLKTILDRGRGPFFCTRI